MKQWTVKTLEDWDFVAQNLVKELTPGTILALSGPLGAGKTTLVQALARRLGVASNPRSPTFSLLRSYKTRTFPASSAGGENSKIRKLIHVDAYRIENAKDLLPLNLDEELMEPGTIIALEWPENVAAWVKKNATRTKKITIINAGDIRRVSIR